MMRNFELLEPEHDHTGSARQGPLAAFDETFKGRDYFHIRRVYRDAHGMWAATGQGISCPIDQKAVMLAALAAYLHIDGQKARAKRKVAKPERDEANPPHEAENFMS